MAKAEVKRGWALEGKAGRERLKLEEKKRKAKMENQAPFRFWLERDSEGKATFLDTPFFFFYEHQMRVDGKWGETFVCAKEHRLGMTCIPCEMGDKPKYSLAATVIDRRTYTSKEGVRYKNTKKLIVFRGKAMEIILRRIDEKQDLRFATFKFCRGTGKNECNVGEDIQFVGRLSEEKLMELIPEANYAERVKALIAKGKTAKQAKKIALKEYLEPYDYYKVFEARDPKSVAAILGYDLEEEEPAVGDEEDEDEDGSPDADESEEEGAEDDDGDDDDGEDDNEDEDPDAEEDEESEEGEEGEEEEEEEEKPKKPVKPTKPAKPAVKVTEEAKPEKPKAAKPKKPRKPTVEEADDITDLMD